MMLVFEDRSEDLPVPVQDRFGCWAEMTANATVSTMLSTDHRKDFRATARMLDLGVARAYAMTYPSLDSRRTPQLIRRSDPEQYQLSLTLRGAQRVTQIGRDTSLGPHDLTLYDSSRPYDCQLIAAEGGTVAFTAVQIPKARFPVPPDRIDRLLAVGMSGRTGIGALLVQFLVRLTEDAHHYRPSDAPRLATILSDLVVALLAHELDAGSSVPPDSHRRVLVLRIQAFIRRHIGEAQLSPAVIAAAHHISARHLHRLFQDQGVTVTAWIRAQRLEGCRRELADPALCLRPISEIAMRWGFSHPAAFSRAFRAAYGVSPRDYRRQAGT
jgi:AraC-like DNA-binding protein